MRRRLCALTLLWPNHLKNRLPPPFEAVWSEGHLSQLLSTLLIALCTTKMRLCLQQILMQIS